MSEFNIGDKVTIRRGKHKGPGVVVLEADPSGQIAVRSNAGFTFITNADNLKAPEEVTVGARKLADAFAAVAAQESDNPSVLNALGRLARRIDGPDLVAAIDWPAQD